MMPLRPAAVSLLILAATDASAITPSRKYHITEPVELSDTTITFAPVSAAGCAAIETRFAIDGPKRLSVGGAPAYAEIAWGDNRLTVRRYAEVADNVYDNPALRFSLYKRNTLLAEADAKGAKTDGGYNSLLLEWSAKADTLTVSAGSDIPAPVITLAVEAPSAADSLTLRAVGKIVVGLFMTEDRTTTRENRLAGIEADSIGPLIAGSTFPAGIYRYLDRAADPAIARLGGRYELAVVPEVNGTFSIVYLSGAEVEAGFWKPGMLKGRLTPTAFRNQYDLEWYDAHGNAIPAAADSYATTDPAAMTLTLVFPSLDGATIRFAAVGDQ